MFDTYERLRPTKTPDGQGGWTTTYSGGVMIAGTLMFHMNETRLLLRSGEDVKPEDTFAINGGYYRVMELTTVPRAGAMSAVVQRVERPIFP